MVGRPRRKSSTNAAEPTALASHASSSRRNSSPPRHFFTSTTMAAGSGEEHPIPADINEPKQRMTSQMQTQTQDGGSKRPRRESLEPSRKSERGQKMRKSESYRLLEKMMFPDALIEAALRACPDNVACAIEYIFAMQTNDDKGKGEREEEGAERVGWSEKKRKGSEEEEEEEEEEVGADPIERGVEEGWKEKEKEDKCRCNKRASNRKKQAAGMSKRLSSRRGQEKEEEEEEEQQQKLPSMPIPPAAAAAAAAGSVTVVDLYAQQQQQEVEETIITATATAAVPTTAGAAIGAAEAASCTPGRRRKKRGREVLGLSQPHHGEEEKKEARKDEGEGMVKKTLLAPLMAVLRSLPLSPPPLLVPAGVENEDSKKVEENLEEKQKEKEAAATTATAAAALSSPSSLSSPLPPAATGPSLRVSVREEDSLEERDDFDYLLSQAGGGEGGGGRRTTLLQRGEAAAVAGAQLSHIGVTKEGSKGGELMHHTGVTAPSDTTAIRMQTPPCPSPPSLSTPRAYPAHAVDAAPHPSAAQAPAARQDFFSPPPSHSPPAAAAAVAAANQFGFQTDRGKQVVVSEEALARVNDISEKDSNISNEVGPEEAALATAAFTDFPPPLPSSGSAFGFQTGRGKQVAISEEALAKVNHMFEEEQSGKSIKRSARADAGGAGEGRRGGVGFEADMEGRGGLSTFSSVPQLTTTNAFGIETGRGWQVPESEEALSKTTYMFEKVESDGGDGVGKENKVVAGAGAGAAAAFGFQTGRGRRLVVSEEALAKVNHMFDEEGVGGRGTSGEENGAAEAAGVAIAVATRAPVQVEKRRTPSLETINHMLDESEVEDRREEEKEDEEEGKNRKSTSSTSGNETNISSSSETRGAGGTGLLIPLLLPCCCGGGGATTVAAADAVAAAGTTAVAAAAVSHDIPAVAIPAVPAVSSTFGFQTGRGRQLDVSEEAMAEVGRMFKKEEGSVGNYRGGEGGGGGGAAGPPPKRATVAAAVAAAPAFAFGFQTGRGRQVDVSEEALAKVNHMFEEVGGGSGGGGVTAGAGAAGAVASAAASAFGFQTGRGRQVDVSEEALAKVNHMFEEVEGGSGGGGVTAAAGAAGAVASAAASAFGFQTGRGRQVDVSEEALAKVNHMFEEVEGGSGGGGVTAAAGAAGAVASAPASAFGFQTGRGRQVDVSEEALAKVNHMFEEVEGGSGGGGVTAAAGAAGAVASAAASAFGFQTGRGRQVDVSEEALAKVNHMFEEVEGGSGGGGVTAAAGAAGAVASAPASAFGFQTGRGRQVDVSEEALAKVNHMFEEVEGGSGGGGVTAAAGAAGAVASAAASAFGFQTGRGRQVDVSEEALAKVNHMFEEVEGGSGGGGVTAAAGAAGAVASAPASAFGFQTGRGRQVDVSEEALAKVNHMFEEVEGGSGGGGVTAAAGAAAAGAGAVAAAASAFGFQTGRGRQVDVSEEALAKVNHMFEEVEGGSGGGGVTAGAGAAGAVASAAASAFGFQTGRGRQVDVSEEALAKVNHMFEEVEGGSGGGGVTAAAGAAAAGAVASAPASAFGFQTGRGRQVDVSEEALAKVNHMFEEVEGGSGGGGVTAGAGAAGAVASAAASAFGFQTGRGRQVDVSEEALAKVNHMFEEVEGGSGGGGVTTAAGAAGAVASAPASAFGFQTGRGRQIDVSEEALAKVNHMFEEVGGGSGGGGEIAAAGAAGAGAVASAAASAFGFQTGRGKQVDVSEEALAKVNHMFEEVEGGSGGGGVTAAAAAGAAVASAPASAFGFQTGRGRQVDVSEEALAKVNHMFEEVGGGSGGGGEIAAAGAAGAGAGAAAAASAFGFQTGRGKQVDVSEEALAKVNHMFEEVEGGSGGGGVTAAAAAGAAVASAPASAFGFQTGRGRQVDVSEEALAKVNHMFEEVEGGSGGGGVTAAAGAAGAASAAKAGEVEVVAAEAISAAGAAAPPAAVVFAEPGVAIPARVLTFQTGESREMSSSEEAREKEDSHIFDNGEEEQQQQQQSQLQAEGKGCKIGGGGGNSFIFQTGRGREMSISEEAVAKVSHMFDSADVQQEQQEQEQQQQQHHLQTSTIMQLVAEEERQNLIHLPPLPAAQLEREKDDSVHPVPLPPFSLNHHLQPPSASPAVLEQLALLPPPTQCKDLALLDLRALAQDKYGKQKNNKSSNIINEGEREDGRNENNSTSRSISKGGNADDKRHEEKVLTARLTLRDLGMYPGSIPQYLLPSYGVREETVAISSTNGHLLRFGPNEGGGLPVALLPDLPPSTAIATTAEPTFPPEESANWIAALMASPLCAGKGKAGPRPPPSAAWLTHHYRLIVWKLASLERAFPEVLGGRYLTRARVLQQLQLRYVREMVQGHRSALRTILNGDASAGKLMVLCVTQIHFEKEEEREREGGAAATAPEKEEEKEGRKEREEGKQCASTSPPPPPPLVRVELTDGWYCIDALLDAPLSALVRKGRVCVGGKLAVCGALLQGLSGGGMDPLEIQGLAVEARPHLRLVVNSTRLARWDAILGFQSKPCKHVGGMMAVSVSGLVPGGGAVVAIEVVVLRRYPMMYMERRMNGEGERLSSRVLSVGEEEDAQLRHEGVCQAEMERLLEEKDREAEEEEMEERRQGRGRREERCVDLDLDKVRERCQAEMSTRMEEARREVLDDPCYQRESKPFLRVKLCSVKSHPFTLPSSSSSSSSPSSYTLIDDFASHSIVDVRRNLALLTVWEPSEALLEALQDGRHLMLHGVNPPQNKGDGPPPSLFRLNGSGKSTQARLLSSISDSRISISSCTFGFRSVFNYARYEPRMVLGSIREAMEKFDHSKGPFVSMDFDAVAVKLLSITWEDVRPRQLEIEAAGGGKKGKKGDGKEKRNDRSSGKSGSVRTRIFFTDASGCILCVEKREYDVEGGREGGKSAGESVSKKKEEEDELDPVYALTDLAFQSYDPNTDTVMVTLSAWSGMRKTIHPRARGEAYLREGMGRVSRWAKQTADGSRVLEQERARLLSLLYLNREGGEEGRKEGGVIPPREHFQGSVTHHELILQGGRGRKIGEREGTALRMLVDLGGHGYLPVLCQRQFAVGRLAAAFLPTEVARAVGEDVVRVAEAMTQHQVGWGSIYLNLLVQRVEGCPSGAPSFELLDITVIPAIQQALKALNSLFVGDAEFALLAASVVR